MPIFVEEAYILNHVAKIANIPTVIVQGRYDVVCPAKSAWELHKALPNSNLIIVPDAGHSMGEVSIARELVITTDKI
jgi:proline iminopeptidase